MAWVSSVFFGQAIVGKDLSDESGADLEAPLGECLGDRIPIEIGLETRADDEGLNLLGAFRRRVWAWPFGEEVGWRSVEDGVADIVIGFARLEAEAGGELALGEAAEFPESDHTDLLLDGLFLGEGDGLPSTVSEHERALFGLNFEAKSNMHGRPLSRGASLILERCRYVYVIFAKIKSRTLGRMGRPTQRVLMVINVDIVESYSA